MYSELCPIKARQREAECNVNRTTPGNFMHYMNILISLSSGCLSRLSALALSIRVLTYNLRWTTAEST